MCMILTVGTRMDRHICKKNIFIITRYSYSLVNEIVVFL